jgi:hypothetical protein
MNHINASRYWRSTTQEHAQGSAKSKRHGSIRNVGEKTTELEPGHHTHTATYTEALLYGVLTGTVGYVDDLGIQEGESSPLAHVVLVLGVVALHDYVVLGTSLQVRNKVPRTLDTD